MNALSPIKDRIRTAPHGRRRAERAKASDQLHDCLARFLEQSPHPLDEAARRAVEAGVD